MAWSTPYKKVLKVHQSRWVRAHGKKAEQVVATFVAGEIEKFHETNSLEHTLPGSLVKVHFLIEYFFFSKYYCRGLSPGTGTTQTRMTRRL